MIFEVSKQIVEAIAKAKLSPPVCFGRLSYLETWSGHHTREERFYIGLVSKETMDQKMIQLAIEAEHGFLSPKNCGI